MVNEKKVRIMTQLALDETKRYKQEIDESGYYHADYVRYHTMHLLWGVTLSYLLGICLVALYHMEYLLINLVKMDYRSIGLIALGIYVGMFVVCLIGSILYYSAKYKENRKKLKIYMARLKQLEEFYAEDQEGNDA
ncbi:MAG: hypothetical protein Q4D32_09875 [Eubacteriales bacterium]|nr:hypothetical protein [Eubacteriales bacterium]